MITPNLCRAARVLLGWKQVDLAERSDVGINTIRVFEAGKSKPRKGTLRLLELAFEEAGVEFIAEDGASPSGGPGLRLKG